jgi:nicotinamidase/pyrazinamidase
MTERRINIGSNDLFLAVDVQNDFCPDGALAVPGGDEVVPVINRLARVFRHVVLTQDWHQSDHLSFASSHPGAKSFGLITLPYGEQVLWPDHCVQGSSGAQFHRDLDVPQAELIIRKGFDPTIDSYSAFRENDRRTRTGLAGYLRERGIARLFIAGLALDFCVRYSAEDAKSEGFEIIVVEDACRAIDVAGSLGDARRSFKAFGIPLIAADQVYR